MVNEKVNIKTLSPVAQQLLNEIMQREGTKTTKDTIDKVIEKHAEEHYGITPAMLIRTKDGIIPLKQNSGGGDGKNNISSSDIEIDKLWSELMRNMSRNMKYKQIKQLMSYVNNGDGKANDMNTSNSRKEMLNMIQDMAMMDKLMKSLDTNNDNEKNKYNEQLLNKIAELEKKIEKNEEDKRIERLERMIENLNEKIANKNNDFSMKDILQLALSRDSKLDELHNKISEEKQRFLEEKLMNAIAEWKKDINQLQAGNQNRIGEMIENIKAIKEITNELGLNNSNKGNGLKEVISDLVGRTITAVGDIAKSQTNLSNKQQIVQPQQQVYYPPEKLTEINEDITNIGQTKLNRPKRKFK